MANEGKGKDPPPVKGKLSFLQPETARAEDALPRSSSATLPPPPTSGREWIQLATQLLTTHHHQMEKRGVDVCQEAALALLDEAERKEEAEARASRSATASPAGQPGQRGYDDYSPREQDAEAPATPRKGGAATAERVEAAYVLVAGCTSAIERNTVDSLAKAVSLAQQACRAWNAPMCSLALAWAHHKAAAKLPERSAQDAALSAATAAAASSAAALLRAGSLDKDDEARLVRVAWLLAALGEAEGAQLCVNQLLRANPKHLMGLLLLSMLHTVDGDSGSAMAAAVRLVQEHPGDIAGALMLTALKQHTGPTTDSDAEDTLNEELGVVLARVRAFSTASTERKGQGHKRTLKAFCTHPAPGEVVFEEGTAAIADADTEASSSSLSVVLTSDEACRRAAGYWALLAYLCVRVGAFPMAEMVIEAGLEYVSSAKSTLHRKAFADLLCCRARMALTQLWDKVPPTTAQNGLVRDVNLLGHIQPARTRDGAAPTRVVVGAPSSFSSPRTEARGGMAHDTAPFLRGGNEPPADASRLLSPRDLGAIFTYLLKATEAYPDHAEAHYLMGVVRLLEASQPDLPRRTVEQKRASAAAAFTETMRVAPLYVEPHLGLGCVREAQGAMDVALDIYASAAELSFRDPLLPFDRFLFLFE